MDEFKGVATGEIENGVVQKSIPGGLAARSSPIPAGRSCSTSIPTAGRREHLHPPHPDGGSGRRNRWLVHEGAAAISAAVQDWLHVEHRLSTTSCPKSKWERRSGSRTMASAD